MTRINLHEAKSKFAYYTRKVKAGETIVLCDRNKPFAEIRPLPLNNHQTKPPRKLGMMKEWVVEVPTSFNDPLTEMEDIMEASVLPPVGESTST